MPRVDCTLRVTLVAPFLFPGITAGRFGFDRVALRGPSGRPIIPQDQVRGLIRHGMERLGHGALVRALFGAKSGDGADPSARDFSPESGNLFSSDLVAAVDPQPDTLAAHRVKIDAETGSADEGHLLTVEQLWPPETRVVFSGSLVAFTDLDPATFRELVTTALETHLTMGALGSIGFGLVEAVQCLNADSPAPARVASLGAGRWLWRFALDRPYLVDSDRVAKNAYRGSNDIPGGALKGVIAAANARLGWGIPDDVLAVVRIGFATDELRPTLAHSFVRDIVDDDQRDNPFVDLAFSTAVGIPKPQIDWKDEDWAQSGLKRVEAKQDERVHVEIDPVSGAAKDQMLYSTIAIVPERPFGAEIDLTGLDQVQSARLLELIAQPLEGLGRRGTAIRTLELSRLAWPSKSPAEGRTALILTSPGYLVDPEDGSTPFLSYATFWKGLLPSSRLEATYARQRLAGGYLARRYRPTGAYRPFLLTEPGSVFVIHLAESDRTTLTSLLFRGICRDAVAGVPLDWRNCPFVATNGYGALDLHTPRRGQP